MPWREQILTEFKPGARSRFDDTTAVSKSSHDSQQGSVGVVSGVGSDEPEGLPASGEAEVALDSHDAVSHVDVRSGSYNPAFSDEDLELLLREQQEIAAQSDFGFDVVSAVGSVSQPVPEEGGVLNSGQFDSLVAHNVLTNLNTAEISMPWERGVYRNFFDRSRVAGLPQSPSLSINLQNVSMWNRLPTYHAAMDEISHTAAGVPLCESLYSSSMLNISDLNFEAKIARAKDVAVAKWLAIIKLFPAASDVGRQIESEAFGDEAGDVERRIVEAVLGVRSPNTAIARANSILRLIRWLVHSEIPDETFLSEKQVWRYLQYLRDTEAKPSTGAQLVSALRYCKYIFGFTTLDDAVRSRRVVGLSELLLSAKQFLKQAKVLTVQQVCLLHMLLENESKDIWDRALAGYTLVALYARARHSDLVHIAQAVSDFDHEGGFWELRTAVHKNSRSARKKSMLLPILIPCRGVSGTCWPITVCAIFREIGLELEGVINGPIFRPASKKGGLCARGITSFEVTRFLNLAIHGVAEPSDDIRLTSHSLKATSISWSSKYGLPASDKAILGRHSSSVNQSTAIYERDMSVRAVTLLQNVIDNIFERKFFPDAPRSEYFPRPSVQQAETEVDPVSADWDGYRTADINQAVKEETCFPSETITISDDSSCDDLSASSASAESTSEEELHEDEELDAPAAKVARLKSCQAEDGIFWIHRVSKIVHLKGKKSTAEAVTFACGRRSSNKYISVRVFGPSSMCRLCRTHAALE